MNKDIALFLEHFSTIDPALALVWCEPTVNCVADVTVTNLLQWQCHSQLSSIIDLNEVFSDKQLQI